MSSAAFHFGETLCRAYITKKISRENSITNQYAGAVRLFYPGET
jgi:hypothetical protein